VFLAPEGGRFDAVLRRKLASPYLISSGLNRLEPQRIAEGWKIELILVYLVRIDERELGIYCVNRLTPNDPYRVRTAPLNSKRCILYIYSTNIGTEYFKHGIYSPFFCLKMQFVS